MAECYKMHHVEIRCTPPATHFTAEVWILTTLTTIKNCFESVDFQ